MQREILFKAKKDNSEWIEGSLLILKNGYYIVPKGTYYNEIYDDTIKTNVNAIWEEQDFFEVIPETVCQGTVLKNGLKIFEGDIYHHGDPDITYTVVWHDSGLIGKQNKSSSYAGLEAWSDRIQIIGNRLDEKVEIIEEDKDIEEITINGNGNIGFPNGEWTARKMDEAFAFKINELIREMNKLKNR